MSFGLSPFGSEAFGELPSSGVITPVVVSGVGASNGASAALGVRELTLWEQVVFQADFDPVNPAYDAARQIIDYKGHTVTRPGAYPRLQVDNAATGKGYLASSTGLGQVAYVAGLLPEFDGFKLSDKWTIEFRLSTSSFGQLLTIQGSTGLSPLTIQLDSSGGMYSVFVQPQDSPTGYQTGFIFPQGTVWRSFVIECDGTAITVVENATIVTPLTQSTSMSVNTASDAALVLFGTTTTSSSKTHRLDELRITKTNRYGGSGYPSNPWPYFNGREGWTSSGVSQGSANVVGFGEEATFSVVAASGQCLAVSTALAVSPHSVSASGVSEGASVCVAIYKRPPVGAGLSPGQSTVVGKSASTHAASGECFGSSTAVAVADGQHNPTAGVGTSVSSAYLSAQGSFLMLTQSIGATLGSSSCTGSASGVLGRSAFSSGSSSCTGSASGVLGRSAFSSGASRAYAPGQRITTAVGVAGGSSIARSWFPSESWGITVYTDTHALSVSTKKVQNVFIR